MAEPESMAAKQNVSNRKKRKNEDISENNEESKKFKSKIEDDEKMEDAVKTPTVFSVSEFRAQLRGVDCMKSLRDFANCAEWKTTENDVVLEYLQSGGSIHEIVSLLDVTAQADLATALPVFRAVYNILLKIQSEAKEYEIEAKSSVENLLTTFVPAMQAMVNLNTPKHRKVVLKMLTAIVTFNPTFGRQILNWFSLTPTQQEQYCEPGPVRKAFIMFLMAFFVDGKASLFRPLIEKKGLLNSIIPNLKYDDANTVAVVLTVLKDKMLMNPGVNKTLKLTIFNTQAIQSLLQLYDWVGPRGAQKGWKKPKKMAAVDEEALILVTSALDEFLILLCTCRKHGVAFWDKTLGAGTPMNQILFTAMDVVPKPWKRAEYTKLVVKILEGSPDLIKPCLVKWERSFEPRDSIVWVRAVDFLIQVIESLNAESIISAALEVTSAEQLQMSLRSLIYCPSIMNHLTSALVAENPLKIRYHALRVLKTMIVKHAAFLEAIPMKKGRKTVQKSLSHAIISVLPSAKSICKMWTEHEDSNNCEPKDLIIAEFVLAVAQLDTSMIDNPRVICKCFIEGIETRESSLQSAVLQAISLLDPTFLTPDSDQFEPALKILLLLSSVKATRKGSLTALATMLLGTGLWDGSPEELDVWLGAWLRVKQHGQSLIGQILVQTVRRTASKLKNDTGKKNKLLTNFIQIASKSEMNETEQVELKQFVTDVVIQLSCLSDKKVKQTQEMNQLLLVNVELFLKGDEDVIIGLIDPFKTFSAWLLSGQEEEELDLSGYTLDLFDWSSLFLVTLHHISRWLSSDEFTAERQMRSKECIKTILKATQRPTGASWQTLLSLDPKPTTLFNKIMALLLANRQIFNIFRVWGVNESADWLMNLFNDLGIENTNVNPEILLPWRTELYNQLNRLVLHAKYSAKVSSGLQFWLEFLRLDEQQFLSFIEALCCRTICKKVISSSALATMWCTFMNVDNQHIIPQVLGVKISIFLSKMVVHESSNDNYLQALLRLVTKYPLSLLHFSKHFMKKVLIKKEPGEGLIKIAKLCLQIRVHRVAFLKKYLKDYESANSRTALAMLDTLIDYYPPRKGDNFRRIDFAINHLRCEIWQDLVLFIRGKEDPLLLNHPKIVAMIIQEKSWPLAKRNEKVSKALEEALGEAPPHIELLFPLASVASHERNKRLLSWLQDFFKDSNQELSWKKKSEVFQSVQQLLKDDSFILKEFVKLRLTEDWKQFVNDTLRNISVTADVDRLKILRIVTSSTYSEGADNRKLSELFHKCTSHSEFINIMLSDSPMKGEVIGFLATLVRLYPEVMVLGHVPIYLAAYNASLSNCDQQILELLRVYESHCGSLSKFDPLFWGQPAIQHYSVRGTGGLSLWRQVTMKSILELLDFEKMKKTIIKFPINRKLQGILLEDDAEIYDPAFLMPLFSNLFSPGAVSYCLSFIHQGALSLTICALSSADKEMRSAAAVVLLRFYAHFQLTQHSKQKPVWLHIIDSIRYGLANLMTTPLPGYIAVFLSRAVLEVADPSSPMYSLHRFIIAKPAFNLKSVPEFLSLFYSDELHYATQRKWMLEILRDGIKQQSDSIPVVKSPAFKIFLTTFTISYTPPELKALILQVVEKIVRMTPPVRQRFNEMGILSWMRNISGLIHGPLLEPFIALCETMLLKSKEMQENRGEVSVTRSEIALIRFVTAVTKKASNPDISSYLKTIKII